MRPRCFWAAFLLCLAIAPRSAHGDTVLACFEGADYGGWKTTGEAFGPGPARGALPGQMPVSGYVGHGLANSFFHGDGSVGTLTSPDFHINYRYLNFLIGGGNHPGKTCLNLVVDGKVVCTATGRDSEQLIWRTFDLSGWHGKAAHIEIVDDEKGGWGHVLVDEIRLSDDKAELGPASREIMVEKRGLNLPVKKGAPKRKMRYLLDEKTVREFEIELADGEPDYWVFDDASDFNGKKLRIEVDDVGPDFKGLAAVEQGDAIGGGDDLYREKHRPQFHFTSRRGWLNDPNGLVYSDGEYHLFYQHNPYGWDWGNMHWGHAVSADLVHWTELPIALYPRRFGDWCFSGSAVVDPQNTSGFQEGKAKPLVAAYTSTGRGECIAYSNDRGRTWTDFKEDPVVKHNGRDPRLLWHEPTKQWVMAVYDEADGKRWIAFYTSRDLKKWECQSRIEGFFECPDLFELPVEGGAAKKWVLYSGDAKYVIGDFDGKTFTPDAKDKQQLWYGNFYAAQTYSNAPDGRRIQIGWGDGIVFPDMPFNQQMAFPCRLTLHRTADGLRMFAEPVQEIESLHAKKHALADRLLKPGDNPLAEVSGDLFDIRAEFEPAGAEAFGFTIRGVPVVYDAKKQEISCRNVTAPLKPEDGKVRLQLLVDRGSIEIFGAGGRVALSVGVIPADDNRALEVFSRGGAVKLRSLEAFEMKSAWEAP
ncbi:MAG TPA: glycoside hydrolase family 32 protein [Gemmataceae bacterium]|nr:glycoside hydrolase family 32 protein [Gemmataceae bacterium]